MLQTLIGRFTCDTFVNADKVRNTVISASCGDLADRCAPTAEHFFRLIDARAVEVLLKGHTRYSFKAARKITVTHTKAFGKLALVHILGVVVANVDHRVINERRRLIMRRFFVCRGVAAQDLDQELHNFELGCHL